VFKRDGFTCQYCGKQPPEVVLVVDHILPVCEGGSDGAENLTTACEACNQGKAGLSLVRPIRPDADLLYLEAQQEIAELRRYQIAKAERDSALWACVETLQKTWAWYTGSKRYPPTERFILALLSRYPPERVEEAFRITAPKVEYLNGAYQQYVWGVLKHLDESESDDEEE
jgi:hypothetical protein